MTNFTVTLAAFRKAGACYSGYNKVVRALQGKPFTEADASRESYIRFSHKEPISIKSIIETNGLDDALWALRCVKGADRDIRLFAVWCTRQVQHLMTDKRSTDALDVAERHANGEATDADLSAAGAAAWAAAGDAAGDAAGAAAGGAAAGAAAWAAAGDAAWAAAGAAAGDAAKAAAKAAAWAAQRDMLARVCDGDAPWQDGSQIQGDCHV